MGWRARGIEGRREGQLLNGRELDGWRCLKEQELPVSTHTSSRDREERERERERG